MSDNWALAVAQSSAVLSMASATRTASVAVKLGTEQLRGSAKDNLMDQGKLLLLDPVLVYMPGGFNVMH